MYRYRLEYIKDDSSLLAEEHALIINAIEKKNVVEAKKYVERHIENQEKTISAKLTAEKAAITQ